jgi:hypothetical protein
MFTGLYTALITESWNTNKAQSVTLEAQLISQ